MDEFEYNTTLNGGIISVILNVDIVYDEDGSQAILSLKSIYFEATDVTSILSKETQNELEMEAEAGFYEDSWEKSND